MIPLLGVDAAPRFLLRDVGLSDFGPRRLTDVLVKSIFLQVQFHGYACHCIFLGDMNSVRRRYYARDARQRTDESSPI